MSSSRLSTSSSLYLLSFALLLHSALGVGPLYHFCSSSSGNFTANSPYKTNLNKLTSSLYIKSPPTGFGVGSSGENPDRANGLALCRGDVSTPDCKACIVEASNEIRRRCEFNRGAIIWYDNCLFKYTDKDFFGQVDYQNRFYMWNLQNVSEPTTFNRKTRELLGELAEEASVARKMYAAGELDLGESQRLYGLAQCTRDLSSVACKKCLDDAISELPSCCDGKQGGRVVGGSCNIGYEIYPFVNA